MILLQLLQNWAYKPHGIYKEYRIMLLQARIMHSNPHTLCNLSIYHTLFFSESLFPILTSHFTFLPPSPIFHTLIPAIGSKWKHSLRDQLYSLPEEISKVTSILHLLILTRPVILLWWRMCYNEAGHYA